MFRHPYVVPSVLGLLLLVRGASEATNALVPLLPIMIVLTLFITILEVRSIAIVGTVLATIPLELIGPFGILMPNKLILIGQIEHNLKERLAPFEAVVKATVQCARPVILTALVAMHAFISLIHSVPWGMLAYTLTGGTFAGTILTLVFLPAMYATWLRIRPTSIGATKSALQVGLGTEVW